MASNGIKNLIPNSERTPEELREMTRKGGIASGEARRKKKAMREMLEMCLNMKDKETGKTYRELATVGLIKGAINGDPRNYKVMMETLGELNEIEENKKQQELSKVEELLTKLTEEANK